MSKTAEKKKNPVITEALYQAISAPLITEKATMASEHNKIVFRVPLTADKAIIKRAVEALFKVKVEKVNTSVQKGKMKVFKGRKARRNDTKKAVVTLVEGEMVDVSTGV